MIKKFKELKNKILSSPFGPLVAVLCNLFTAMAVYMLARLVFVAVNWDVFSSSPARWAEVVKGGLMFDASAVMYTLALYLVLVLLPLHWKETDGWQRFARWLWLTVSGITLTINLMDCVYFRYTNRRTTSTVFSEFGNEDNLAGIIGTELVRHWYLVLLAAAVLWLMWKMYVTPRVRRESLRKGRYYVAMTLSLVAMAPLVVGGMRGGLAHAVRPITVSNANQYVDRPIDAAMVLNTPFSILRTLGKNVYEVPHFFANESELAAAYTPERHPAASEKRRHNVVILIVESYSKEFIGSMNRDLDGGRYRGFTPFVDSLAEHSLTFRYSYANGRKSIDAMPSTLSSIPMMVEPFFLTPASMNHLSGIARLLGDEGYQSAFFHGAQNGSMGFQAFARATGYQAYYGRDEYNADPAFHGDADYDGMWAIWDEPFLQFTEKRINTMRQPFVATMFTASSHHPFRVPDKYAGVFKDEDDQPIHKCVRYTDMALRRFFESASREPWYNNTLFVLVADHTNQLSRDEYLTDLGIYEVPIIFYTPDGSIEAACRDDVIAQQASILPTILGYLGYDKPYVAFGCDLLHDDPADTWAFSYNNGSYQLVKGDWFLQFDGSKTTGLYRFKSDRLLRHNLAGRGIDEQKSLERQLKALIQQYMSRMTGDRLVYGR